MKRIIQRQFFHMVRQVGVKVANGNDASLIHLNAHVLANLIKLVPLQKDAVSATVLNVRKYCEFAHAHLQPGHVDTEKASNALLQAVYFSDELQAQFNKVNGFVREHGKVLSAAYSQYAHFLYSTQPIEEALPKIEQLLKTALSLNPKNEQAHEVQLTMKFNWQKQNPSPGL